MIDIKAHLNELEIISSGSSHLVESDILKLDFGTTKLEITFKTDKEFEDSQISYVVEENILKVSFINYNTSYGSGILTPWRIGILDGRELFTTIYIRHVDFNSSDYFICNYIFYSGKEVTDGE